MGRMSELPRVVITTLASADGRIALNSSSVLMQEEVARRWASMKPDGIDEVLEGRRREHGATVTLEGSGSLVLRDTGALTSPEPPGPTEHLYADHLARRAPEWFVVADSRGRVDWSYTGDDVTALLVLVCAQTPAGYLQMLRDRGIGYLVAGDDRVDLREGLAKIRSVLGADTVVADSGGTLNAALLRAGLVDEIDIVLLPGLVGGTGTPSIVDGPQLGDDEVPIRLELLDHAVLDGGAVRLRYRVLR